MPGPRRSGPRKAEPAPPAPAAGAQAGPGAAPARSRAADLQLHICPRCRSQLLQPTSWEALGSRWLLGRRCPDCGWRGAGVFSADALERFDEVLDDGAAALVATLRELTEQNMRAEVELLSAALARGLLLPEDF